MTIILIVLTNKNVGVNRNKGLCSVKEVSPKTVAPLQHIFGNLKLRFFFNIYVRQSILGLNEIKEPFWITCICCYKLILSCSLTLLPRITSITALQGTTSLQQAISCLQLGWLVLKINKSFMSELYSTKTQTEEIRLDYLRPRVEWSPSQQSQLKPAFWPSQQCSRMLWSHLDRVSPAVRAKAFIWRKVGPARRATIS